MTPEPWGGGSDESTMTTAMVVMEHGSEWPGQIGDSMKVIAFSHDGEDLLRRTQRSVGALRGLDGGIRVAVLACNLAAGGAAADRRAQLAHALLGAVASTNRGRLVLRASGIASHQQRQELLGLAQALTKELRGTTATVLVRFAEVWPRNAVATSA
jgi:hypothetical protein